MPSATARSAGSWTPTSGWRRGTRACRRGPWSSSTPSWPTRKPAPARCGWASGSPFSTRCCTRWAATWCGTGVGADLACGRGTSPPAVPARPGRGLRRRLLGGGRRTRARGAAAAGRRSRMVGPERPTAQADRAAFAARHGALRCGPDGVDAARPRRGERAQRRPGRPLRRGARQHHARDAPADDPACAAGRADQCARAGRLAAPARRRRHRRRRVTRPRRPPAVRELGQLRVRRRRALRPDRPGSCSTP